MRFLLDTHVLLWWRDASPLLSPLASAEIAAGENEVLVSIASLWEITIKRQASANSRLRMISRPSCVRSGSRCSGFHWQHLRRLDTLPSLHRDPFDRY